MQQQFLPSALVYTFLSTEETSPCFWYAYNTCGNGRIFSFLWNKLIFLPLPSHRPQMSKPYPSSSLCTLTQQHPAQSMAWPVPTALWWQQAHWQPGWIKCKWGDKLGARSVRELQVLARGAPGQWLHGAEKDLQCPDSYNGASSPCQERKKMLKISIS